MPNKLGLYLFRQTVAAFVFAAVAVVFVVLFTQSFRMLSFVIDNSGTMLIFFQLMGLSIPTFLPLVVPLSLGLAVIFTYHKMAMDSEIVVMRAAGLSPMKIAAPALALSGLVVLFGYLMTTSVTPWANRELVSLQYKVRDSFSIFLVRAGAFNDLTPGLTFYTRARGKSGELEGILIHDVRIPQKPVTVMADSGQFTTNEFGDPQITVFKGKRQEIDPATGHLSQLDFDRYVVDLQILRNSAATRSPDAREKSMIELLDTTDESEGKATPQRRYAEFHQRLTSPLLSLSFALIGLTAILVGEFNRRGMAQRLAIAGLSVVVLEAATLSISSLLSKSVWLTPALYIVVILPVPICLAVLAGHDLLHGRKPRSAQP